MVGMGITCGDPCCGHLYHKSLLMSLGLSGITAFGRDPLQGHLQRLNEPFGSSFLFPQPLQRASSLRVFGKINDPAGGGIHLIFAERGGFEPPIPFRGILAFQASQFNHSCISPKTAQFTQFFLMTTSSAHFAAERPGEHECHPLRRKPAAKQNHHLRHGCLSGDVPAADHSRTEQPC
jgi:hypothetical protein